MNAEIITQVLALSDERDQWMKRLLDAEHAAYLRGYEDGRADQAAASDRAWAAIPVLKVSIIESQAELRRLRGYASASEPLEGDQRTAQIRQQAYDSGLLPITPAYFTEPYWEDLRRLPQHEGAL